MPCRILTTNTDPKMKKDYDLIRKDLNAEPQIPT